ncbi:DUF421 domain-containing protein [Myroides injenensis]|uniref:DUF421 domain-containing protein n=1 Tax=Myroides injenensis TaxID=1183151 RepID=UPI000289377E|nr:YetF domain-containing protein [Myroides injenensis]
MEFYLLLFLKLLVGFLLVICHLNFTGKTQISQMNAVDLIGNFILGGVIGGIIYSDSISFVDYIISLVIAILLINVLSLLVRKTNFFRAFAIGSPITLIRDGKFCIDVIKDKRNKIDIYTIAANLRVMGHSTFSDIEFLQVEPNGQLSIVERSSKKPLPSKLLYFDGVFALDDLAFFKMDSEWLINKCKGLGVEEFEEVYFIEHYDNKINVVLKDGTIIQ